jgi:site-specific recombinase XerD
MGSISTGSYDFTCRHGGIHGIRWKDAHTGKRREVSLRTTDIDEARRIAPQVFAAHVTGGTKENATNFIEHPSKPLKELIAKWIAEIASELGKDTDKTYTTYGKHWLKHMKLLGDVRSSSIGNYQRARLKVVLRGTVELELSALRRFFKWMKEQEYIRGVPEFPELGAKVLGTNFAVRRRTKPTVVFSSDEMERIIERSPEWSKRKVRGSKFPVRARFIVARDSGLRPTTIDGLKGKDLMVSGLHIRPENDKNRWERVVDVTPRARAAMESVMPEDPEALIFGQHEWGKVFYPIVLEALGPEVADRMTPYDLKHGLVTEMFDAGAPETGIQFQVGTVSAIRRYSHPNRKAGEEALRKVFGGRAGDKASGDHGGQPKTRLSVVKAVKSYLKPNSKNVGKVATLGRRKARRRAS